VGRLVLVPWHIGNAQDLTFRAVAEIRLRRLLLVESVPDARRELQENLRLDLSGKELLAIPEQSDAAFLERVLAALSHEDAAMLASGGTPAFIDPGAWLVAELRKRGVEIAALAGASCLTNMLALSGVEWRVGRNNSFTFAFFLDSKPGGEEERRFKGLARRKEPLFVLLPAAAFERCLRVLGPAVGRRPVTVFFDMTKRTRGKYPMAEKVLTMTCERWLKAAKVIPWDKVSDLALMVGR
jgi:16S rRNA C1402 (ribose-2'-O) methylase RsmI